mgnify:CR=1 FL=1
MTDSKVPTLLIEVVEPTEYVPHEKIQKVNVNQLKPETDEKWSEGNE